MILQEINVMNSFNRVSYQLTSFGKVVMRRIFFPFRFRFVLQVAASASLELFAFFSPKLSDLDDSAISIVFKILNKDPQLGIKIPETRTPKPRTPKTRTPKTRTQKRGMQNLGCRYLEANVKRRVIVAISIQFICCLRLFQNVCKKIL